MRAYHSEGAEAEEAETSTATGKALQVASAGDSGRDPERRAEGK